MKRLLSDSLTRQSIRWLPLLTSLRVVLTRFLKVSQRPDELAWSLAQASTSDDLSFASALPDEYATSTDEDPPSTDEDPHPTK
jgi:hypothetical protein